MITKEGLEDQLLELTVSKERPDLEETRLKIIEQNHSNNVKMDEVENDILTTLSSVEGNILDNENAINTLKRSKSLSTSIKEKQKVSEQNQIQNDEARKVYRKMANHGTLIFFCTTSLVKVNAIYEYSLTWFNNMYARAFKEAERSTFVEQRIDNIIERLNYIIYSNVCRGLYEKDKLIFSFLLTITILRKNNSIDENQLDFFVSPFDLTPFKQMENPLSYVTDE